MTTTTNAKPASQGGATFLDISGSRKMTNNIATAVVWGAMLPVSYTHLTLPTKA